MRALNVSCTWSVLLYALISSAGAAEPSAKRIQLTERPPNLESNLTGAPQAFTPTEQFFVRSHLAQAPRILPMDWRLKVEGEGIEKGLSLSLQDLKKSFKAVEVPALAFCSGNGRAKAEPRIPGVQWKDGAMGNARWKGVRLRDLLLKAGIRTEAVEVVFDGADDPVLRTTPDYQKSLPISKALDPDTLIAYEMNGKPLPPEQGYPARLVVPGWTATYWVKQLVAVRAVRKPFDGYWMAKAYRISRGKFPDVETRWPGQTTELNTPITEIAVGSLITEPGEGATVAKGQPLQVRGVAWDGGHGIAKVEISSDGGKTWTEASLERELGPYSWRLFRAEVSLSGEGPFSLLSRATNRKGQTQPEKAVPNPGGYHQNAVSVRHLAGAVVPSQAPLTPLSEGSRALLTTHCAACHSLDYLEMNAPVLDRKGWEMTLKKMIQMYGAPVPDEALPRLLDVLAERR